MARRLLPRSLLPLLLAAVPVRAAPPPPSPPLDLRVAPPDGENLTVRGTRRPFRAAPIPGVPVPGYGEGRDAIRDTMTGTDLSAFGDAYPLGGVMGDDERSNETGGPYVAPRHP